MTSWIIHFFFDPNKLKWRHFPSCGAAIIAAKLAHSEQETSPPFRIDVYKAKTTNLTQRSLIDILNGKPWQDGKRTLVYTVGVGGGHDVQWYDTDRFHGSTS